MIIRNEKEKKQEHHPFGGSQLDRYSICPLSYTLGKNISEEQPSISAEEGTRLHRAVETADITDLAIEDIELVEKANKASEKILEEYGEPLETLVEQSLSLPIENWHSTADKVFLYKDFAILIDWKFGRIFRDNFQQLRAYSTAILEEENIKEVHAYAIYPRLHKATKYLFSNFQSNLEEIQQIINNCQENPYMAKLGKHCHYCKGNHSCQLQEVSCSLIGGVDTRSIAEKNDDELQILWEKKDTVEKFIKSLKYQIEKRINQNGQCGKLKYKISSGGRYVEDQQKLFSLLKQYFTAEEFLSFSTLSISKLEKGFIEKYVLQEGGTKKDAKEMFCTLCAELLGQKSPRKSIVMEV